jgi:hypothetical protein
VPKTIGSSQSVGRKHRIDSSDNCLELDKEYYKGTPNKGILSISKLFGEGVASYDIDDKLSPNVREFKLRG